MESEIQMESMIQIEWRDGELRAEASSEARLLARFLEGEVQGSLRSGFELLDILDDLTSGRRESYAETGNALTLELTAEKASLQSELSEESLDLDPADLRRALADWLIQLARGPR